MQLIGVAFQFLCDVCGGPAQVFRQVNSRKLLLILLAIGGVERNPGPPTLPTMGGEVPDVRADGAWRVGVPVRLGKGR